MNDSDAQKSISNLFGIIQGIIPYDKKLTNEEKLELIYTRETILEEKIEAIKKIFDQSRMKRMSLAEEFGEEELTGMNNAIEKIVYS